ncbi:MAG: hypothetical protein JJE53_03665 [Candidatus Pacebacteria bacterium]|nr:hypothetical protein [Candidatus Paceibacterota bacterium]
MNNKVLIGAVAAVIILIGGFFVWKSNSPVQELTPSTNTTVSRISSDTQGALAQLETAKLASVPAEWESYSLKTANSDLTFKHPTSVIFKKLDASSNSEGGVSIYYDTDYTRVFVAGGGGEPLGMGISVLNGSQKEEDVMAIPIGDAYAIEENYATTSLFGEKAYILNGEGKDSWDRILFTHNGRVYEVVIQYGRPSDEMRSTFYKVLASIEFKQPTSPVSSNITTYEEKLAACYPKNEGCSACQPLMNNSVQHVVETTRRFVNVPKDFYPKEIGSYFSTVSGNATAGYISNGGLPGEGLDATPECWSTYYEFDGNGEVDLKVKSTVKGVPDFFIRFIVSPTQ